MTVTLLNTEGSETHLYKCVGGIASDCEEWILDVAAKWPSRSSPRQAAPAASPAHQPGHKRLHPDTRRPHEILRNPLPMMWR